MIPETYSTQELINRYCRPNRSLTTFGGYRVKAGTLCRIISVITNIEGNREYTIQTEKCSQCGQPTYVSKVTGVEFDLVDGPVEEHIDTICNTCKKSPEEDIGGCNCCEGDTALFYQDNENCAFVDSKGEVMVVVKDHTMRFKVSYCPNCGKRFDRGESND